MSTATLSRATEPATPVRPPLRLWLGSDGTRRGGVWWPRSRSLAVEVADLVDHFPAERGRVSRIVYSPPDWDDSARRVPVGRGYIKLGAFPRDDTHEIRLGLSDRTILVVRVIPPAATTAEAEAALREHGPAGSLQGIGAGPASAAGDRGWSDRWRDDGGA